MGAPIAQHVVAAGYVYQHHPGHRNRASGKSQWSISEPAERSIFDGSRVRHWLDQSFGWGLYIRDGRAQYLGVSADHARRLIVAKFVASHSPKVWHGYPADHERKTADIPTTNILWQWINPQYLGPAKTRKIMRGQPCNL